MKKGLYLLLILILLLSGCGNTSSSAVAGEGEIYIYYLNKTGTELVREVYRPAAQDTAGRVSEVYDRMQLGGSSDTTLPPVMSALTLAGVTISDNFLILDLTGTEPEWCSSSGILCLAALTKTAAQLPGITYVMLRFDGEPITNQEGEEIGILNSNSFIDNSSDNPEDYLHTDLVLYFANKSGDKLVRTTLPVNYRAGISLERLVVQQLISGPQLRDVTATLPSSVTLLSINVRDNVCYVNLDEKFISDFDGRNSYIPVYSLVNSLCELPNIEKVQVMINGASISLDMPLSANMDYVEVK